MAWSVPTNYSHTEGAYSGGEIRRQEWITLVDNDQVVRSRLRFIHSRQQYGTLGTAPVTLAYFPFYFSEGGTGEVTVLWDHDPETTTVYLRVHFTDSLGGGHIVNLVDSGAGRTQTEHTESGCYTAGGWGTIEITAWSSDDGVGKHYGAAMFETDLTSVT